MASTENPPFSWSRSQAERGGADRRSVHKGDNHNDHSRINTAGDRRRGSEQDKRRSSSRDRDRDRDRDHGRSSNNNNNSNSRRSRDPRDGGDSRRSRRRADRGNDNLHDRRDRNQRRTPRGHSGQGDRNNGRDGGRAENHDHSRHGQDSSKNRDRTQQSSNNTQNQAAQSSNSQGGANETSRVNSSSDDKPAERTIPCLPWARTEKSRKISDELRHATWEELRNALKLLHAQKMDKQIIVDAANTWILERVPSLGLKNSLDRSKLIEDWCQLLYSLNLRKGLVLWSFDAIRRETNAEKDASKEEPKRTTVNLAKRLIEMYYAKDPSKDLERSDGRSPSSASLHSGNAAVIPFGQSDASHRQQREIATANDQVSQPSDGAHPDDFYYLDDSRLYHASEDERFWQPVSYEQLNPNAAILDLEYHYQRSSVGISIRAANPDEHEQGVLYCRNCSKIGHRPSICPDRDTSQEPYCVFCGEICDLAWHLCPMTTNKEFDPRVGLVHPSRSQAMPEPNQPMQDRVKQEEPSATERDSKVSNDRNYATGQAVAPAPSFPAFNRNMTAVGNADSKPAKLVDIGEASDKNTINLAKPSRSYGPAREPDAAKVAKAAKNNQFASLLDQQTPRQKRPSSRGDGRLSPYEAGPNSSKKHRVGGDDLVDGYSKKSREYLRASLEADIFLDKLGKELYREQTAKSQAQKKPTNPILETGFPPPPPKPTTAESTADKFLDSLGMQMSQVKAPQSQVQKKPANPILEAAFAYAQRPRTESVVAQGTKSQTFEEYLAEMDNSQGPLPAADSLIDFSEAGAAASYKPLVPDELNQDEEAPSTSVVKEPQKPREIIPYVTEKSTERDPPYSPFVIKLLQGKRNPYIGVTTRKTAAEMWEEDEMRAAEEAQKETKDENGMSCDEY